MCTATTIYTHRGMSSWILIHTDHFWIAHDVQLCFREVPQVEAQQQRRPLDLSSCRHTWKGGR